MSRFRDELRIIPATAKWIAALVGLAIGTAIGALAICPHQGEQPLPFAAKILLPLMAFMVSVSIILLIGYIHADAKRRGMRYVMWTLLAIFIPDAIGIILYFILRDAMPVTCPACAAPVLAKFTFCPSCGTAARPTCPMCGKAVEHGWSNCAYCGGRLPLPQPQKKD
jgi:hypothetical protein